MPFANASTMAMIARMTDLDLCECEPRATNAKKKQLNPS